MASDRYQGNSSTPELPPMLADLRRYARTLTGSQKLGDALHSLALEDTDFDKPNRNVSKIDLYRVVSRIWTGPVGEHWRDDALKNAQATNPLQRQLNRLTPRSRQAYLLVAMERFAPLQAAEILEMSPPELMSSLVEAQQEIAAQGPANVLIIEDEPLIAVHLESIVADLGHSVAAIARTKDAAVAKAEETQPDIILSDIKLADNSSGVDAVRHITKTRDIPAVFITAYPERLLTGLSREPVFLITKPFRADMVRAVIGQALFWHQDETHAG